MVNKKKFALCIASSITIFFFFMLFFIPLRTPIDIAYPSVEISLTDPTYCNYGQLILTGKYTKYLFSNQPNRFHGELHLPQPYADHLHNYRLFSITTIDMGAYFYGEVVYALGNKVANSFITSGDIYFRRKFNNILYIPIIEQKTGTIIHQEYTDKVIVAPADNLEEAWMIFNEYYSTGVTLQTYGIVN